jgi:hypothetical protein
VEKLEERAGLEARNLFETFIKKVEALKDGKGEDGSKDRSAGAGTAGVTARAR